MWPGAPLPKRQYMTSREWERVDRSEPNSRGLRLTGSHFSAAVQKKKDACRSRKHSWTNRDDFLRHTAHNKLSTAWTQTQSRSSTATIHWGEEPREPTQCTKSVSHSYPEVRGQTPSKHLMLDIKDAASWVFTFFMSIINLPRAGNCCQLMFSFGVFPNSVPFFRHRADNFHPPDWRITVTV